MTASSGPIARPGKSPSWHKMYSAIVFSGMHCVASSVPGDASREGPGHPEEGTGAGATPPSFLHSLRPGWGGDPNPTL